MKRKRDAVEASPRGGKDRKKARGRESGKVPRLIELTVPPRKKRQESPVRETYGERAEIVEVDDQPWVAAANNMVGAVMDLRNDVQELKAWCERDRRGEKESRRTFEDQVLGLLATLVTKLGGSVAEDVRARLRLDVGGAEAVNAPEEGEKTDGEEETEGEEEESDGSAEM